MMTSTFSPKNATITTERLIREDERRLITSISRAQCYQLEKKGLFPARIHLGARSCAWRLSELLAWIEAR
ncbi:transcriptional regulator [Photobacterium phosphoreum]|nr:transcriptional regulator [Photobacterium phosphoreum]